MLNVIRKSDKEILQMNQLILEINHMNPRNSTGDTLLHLIVSKTNTMKSNTFLEDPHTVIFPDAPLTDVFLNCGAEVDAQNYNQSTPLHIACTRSNYNAEVIKHLLSYGAHIDRRNASGSQPHKLLTSISECSVYPLRFISLKCLAARKITEKQISYTGEIPVSLEDFIRIH